MALVRVLSVLLLTLGVILLPWWLVSVMSILGLVFYARFYEIIFLGFLTDMLYGYAFFGGAGLFSSLLFTSGALCAYVAFQQVRGSLKFYA